MPLLAAVLVVHRRRTIETRVVPLTHPQLRQIIARKVGAALNALRGRLGQLMATRPSPRRAHPGGWLGGRVGSDRSAACRSSRSLNDETINAVPLTTPSRTAHRQGHDPLTSSRPPGPTPCAGANIRG
jgi:hypothetical protein